MLKAAESGLQTMMTGATPAELHEILNENTQWLAYKTIKSSNNNDNSETLTIDAALQNAKANAIKTKTWVCRKCPVIEFRLCIACMQVRMYFRKCPISSEIPKQIQKILQNHMPSDLLPLQQVCRSRRKWAQKKDYSTSS